MADSPVIYECEDPRNQPWRAISHPGFGDPNNLTVFEMTMFNGFLYAGTLNPTEGFQVWKTRLNGEPLSRGKEPVRWKRVLTRGAYRGNLNEGVVSMCVFKNALYIGTGIQNGGYDRTFKVGPAAAEVLRIHEDDSFDVVVGTARLTPQGLKMPLSGLRPGFGNYFNAYIWRMAVHGEYLYASTYNWAVFLPYLLKEPWPRWLNDVIGSIGQNRMVERRGGCNLWRTRNGEDWSAVTKSGFGNAYNFGIRTLVSTRNALYAGTANPFGPNVAVEKDNAWNYVPNPKASLEIWRGAAELPRH